MDTQVNGIEDNKPPATPPGSEKRATIGLLCDMLTNRVTIEMWNGVHDAARQYDVNLFYFGGRALREPRFAPYNAIYDLVPTDLLDGLVMWGAQLTPYVSPEEFKVFCRRYHTLPMVNIGLAIPGIPSLLPDNHQGMCDVVTHLIRVHGCRRIAYISGSEHSAEAQERFRGYADALVRHDVPLDSSLVVSWEAVLRQRDRDSGYVYTHTDGIRALLDVQGLRPGVDFDAVVGFNDDQCIGAVRELHARGLHVPGDVKVAGFDDTEEARSITPPLTTVRQSFYNMGWQSVEMLLVLIGGQELPDQVVLPMPVVIRQSCGCIPKTVAQAAAGRDVWVKSEESLATALTTQRKALSLDMARAVASHADQATTVADIDLADHLVEGFAADMGGESPGAFLSAVEDMIRHVVASGGNVGAWQGALSALRQHTLPHLQGEDEMSRAADLWNQARVAVGDAAQRLQSYRTFQSNRRAQLVRDVNQALSTTMDIGALADAVVGHLPGLGIPSFYLSLYEDPNAPTEWSRLILAYDRANAQYPDGRVPLDEGGQRFPSQQLIPAGLLSQNRQYSMVVLPLVFWEEQLGFVLLEAGPPEGDVYQTLHTSLESALYSARLLQQVAERGLQIQTAAEVSRAATGILELGELIQQIVDLVCARFGLYYVGLFLVEGADAPDGPSGSSGWAVLRAGTGEAGRKMLEQGHKLEVGGESMIGRCTAGGRAIIALDVGEEAVRFENPLLPETRSEMALPLISRGEVIGALSIQSTQRAAFSEEDVSVFQTMADQLANAIASARLYDQARQEILERGRVEGTLRQRTLELETRNAELDAFAHTVAHDLKNPVAGLIGLSTMLETSIEEFPPEMVRDVLNRITQAGYKVTGIINALLILSSLRREEVQVEALDMADIVTEARERLADLIVERQAEIIVPDEWPVAVGYALWVEEVWVNYISNALKYGGHPGKGVSPHIELGFDKTADLHIRFWVRDNGPGLVPEAQVGLFTPFTRLHQARIEGHGLGLSIVQRIVEKLGGEVGVESQAGEGSLFYFTLPVAAAAED